MIRDGRITQLNRDRSVLRCDMCGVVQLGPCIVICGNVRLMAATRIRFSADSTRDDRSKELTSFFPGKVCVVREAIVGSYEDEVLSTVFVLSSPTEFCGRSVQRDEADLQIQNLCADMGIRCHLPVHRCQPS